MTNEEIENFIRVLNYLINKCNMYNKDHNNCNRCKLWRVCSALFKDVIMPLEIDPIDCEVIEKELTRITKQELNAYLKSLTKGDLL